MTDDVLRPARLGFGTANLAGRMSVKESLRILSLAWEAGIRHYDTAPMYGYGAAEAVIGTFLRAKSERFTVATKFGIEPPKKTALMTLAKSVARVVVSVVPSVRAKLAARAGAMVSAGNFDVPYAKMSLTRSRSALAGVPIDMLLLHEPPAHRIAPDLVSFLHAAVQCGDVAAYGVACSAAETLPILRSGADYGTVVQAPDGALADARAIAPAGTLFISHSIFSTRLRTFTSALAADSALGARASAALDLDCSDSKRLGRLFLWNAMLRNRGGIVVFSSLDRDSIAKNAALAHGAEFSNEQSAALDTLLAESFA